MPKLVPKMIACHFGKLYLCLKSIYSSHKYIATPLLFIITIVTASLRKILFFENRYSILIFFPTLRTIFRTDKVKSKYQIVIDALCFRTLTNWWWFIRLNNSNRKKFGLQSFENLFNFLKFRKNISVHLTIKILHNLSV